MAQLTDLERGAFREIGDNSFLNYSEGAIKRLREIAVEILQIAADAKHPSHPTTYQPLAPAGSNYVAELISKKK
jgi:hypothetical protein